MSAERKTMVSARLPAAIIARVDFVARNTSGEGTRNRSACLQTALEAWLPEQEKHLEALGVLQKKPRQKGDETR